MTVTLTYDDTLARVRIDATALAAADEALVQRSTDQIRWVTVRGGGAVGVTGGAFDVPLYDYEFSPDVTNYYRVRGVETAAMTYVASGASSAGADGSRAPALPAGLVTHDALFVLASTRNSGTGTVNTPAGYTQVLATGNFALLAAYYDPAVHTGAPTITFTGGATNETTLAETFAIRRASIVPTTSATQLNGVAQGILIPALTIPADDMMVLRAGWKQDDHTSVPAVAGWTELVDFSSALGSDAMMVASMQVQTAAVDQATDSFNVLGGAAAISRSMILAFPHASFLNEQSASIVPTLGSDCGDSPIWLKSIARPFLNQRVTVINRPSVTISRNARVGVFPVVGRTLPVAVSDIRTSRHWTMLLRTDTQTAADNLDLILASGDILLIQTPAECTSVPGGYVAVDDADTEHHPLRPLRKTWTLPVTEVAPPGPDVVGAQSTWQSVLNAYATWSDVIADKLTWADLLELVGDPSEVIVP